jgi:hypothetical protein
MPSTSRAKNERMSESEAVLVDVVRLVARGQADDVPRRVGKLLRGVGGRRSHELSLPCREALSKAVEDAGDSAGLRHIASTARAGEATPTLDGAPALTTAATAPTLSPNAQETLSRIVLEHRKADRLLSHGVSPTRSLLLSGPPGVGKTMTATHIASCLGLPMHRAEPSTIVTSLLGESARNLAGAFNAARREPNVLLLDEFDAFAKRRDDTYEVGELKRFVTTLLVELERGMPHGMLIAATNHPALLDPAVYRRFEVSIELGLPGVEARRQIVTSALENHPVKVKAATLDLVAAVTDGASGSDLVQFLQEALRVHLLEGENLDFALVRVSTARNCRMSRDARVGVAHAARDTGLSTRDTAEILGCSHTTVQRLLELAPGD